MELAAIKATALEYEQTKADRLAADKQSRTLKTKEDQLHAEMCMYCSQQGSGVDLGDVLIEYNTAIKPVAEDWSAIHQFIKDNDAIDLVHRRLTESAVQLRWDDGVVIPGVGDKLVEKVKVIIR